MKHRKLFQASPPMNNSINCPEYCALTCPYNCNEYPDYSTSPPPPTRPFTATENNHFPPAVIILLIIFACVFFLFTCYCIIGKHRPRLTLSGPHPTPSDGPEEELVDQDNHEPFIEHPIWYIWNITTVGLQPSIINAITVFNYKKTDHLIDGTDCSVCLSEFQEGDVLRLLPKCSHAFHIPCIDTWLSSHMNCPACRARVVSDTVTITTDSASNEQVDHGLSPNGDTHVEISEHYGEPNNNSVPMEVCENRVGTEYKVELDDHEMK